MDGWIKIDRGLTDKPIWTCSTSKQKAILIALLTMANFKDSEWEWKGKKYVVKRGQMITSVKSICECAGKDITTQNVRTALARFEKYEFLTIETTKRSSLITIVNYNKYQDAPSEANKQTNNQLTINQQTGNNQLTINQQSTNNQLTTKEEYKERKESKECKEEKESKELKDLKNSCSEHSQTAEPEADVEAIILNDKSEWRPTQKTFEEYTRLYQDIDVKQSFAHMRAWCISNPKKCKTRNGVERFVNSWLAGDQDKASSKKSDYLNRIDNRVKVVDTWV